MKEILQNPNIVDFGTFPRSLIFDLFKSWPKNTNLTLKKLSFKLAVLLLFMPGHRGQIIIALSLDGFEISNTKATFDLKTIIKSNYTGDPVSTVHLNGFPNEKRLGVVLAIRTKTKEVRQTNQLLISFIKPHKAISRDTLARWTMAILKEVGIDTNKYVSHSTTQSTI